MYSVIRNIRKLYKIIALPFMKQETLITFHSKPLIILAQGASLSAKFGELALTEPFIQCHPTKNLCQGKLDDHHPMIECRNFFLGNLF